MQYREAERIAAVDACEKLDKYGILRSGRDADAGLIRAHYIMKPQAKTVGHLS